MSKKPHKSRHRFAPVPWAITTPVVLDEAYQRQVDRSTSKLERQYAQAEKRARQAKARLERARRDTRTKKQQLTELEALVQIRLDELEEYRRIMVAAPASATHRGTKSFRPVPHRDG